MRMTTRGLYAIKAILYLVTISEEQKPVSLSKIAQIENLSPEFLQQIFYKLRKAGIIKSSRGPGGGFSLNKKPEEISAYDVLYAVGETLEIVPCIPWRSTKKVCPRFDTCDVGPFWIEMENIIVEYAKSKSLKDISLARTHQEVISD